MSTHLLSRREQSRAQLVGLDSESVAMIRALARRESFDVEVFSSLDALDADQASDRPTCILCDWLGRDALRRHCVRPSSPPVVVVSKQDSVRAAVEAVRAGTHDYQLRSVPPLDLLDSLNAGWMRHRGQQAIRQSRATMKRQIGTLSHRELEVLLRLLTSDNTKRVDGELATSPKTVEYHRQRIVTKLQADNLLQLTGALLHAWLGTTRPWNRVLKELTNA